MLGELIPHKSKSSGQEKDQPPETDFREKELPAVGYSNDRDLISYPAQPGSLAELPGAWPWHFWCVGDRGGPVLPK